MSRLKKIDSRIILGQKIRERRESSGKSRDEVAVEVGISRSTLERMENGTAPVEISDFINIYDCCSANPKHDFFMITNPEILDNMSDMSKGLSLPDQQPGYAKLWEDAYQILIEIAKSCSLDELVTINYLLSGEYGGDRYAVLQKFLADVQCPPGNRDLTCGIIMNNYEDAVSMGTLPDHALPVNTAYVKRARERGKKAHREGKRTYL